MAADGGTVLVVEMDDVAGLMFFGFWCFFPLFLVLPFVFVFAATRSCGLFGQNRPPRRDVRTGFGCAFIKKAE